MKPFLTRHFKGAVCLLLVFLSIGGMPVSALAADGTTLTPTVQFETNMINSDISEIDPQYQVIMKISRTIYCNNGMGDFSVTLMRQGDVNSCRLGITVQQFKNSAWKDYRYFSASSQTKDCRWIANNVPLEKGYFYRLKIVATVYRGTDFERDTVYSATDAA